MTTAAMPCTPAQTEAIAAMDQAVDRLASVEAEAVMSLGVLDATFRQLVASIQTNDAPERTARLVSDTREALAFHGQKLEAYQDATDDAVVTAGAVVGELAQSPEDAEASFLAHFAEDFLVVGADNLSQAGMVDLQNSLMRRVRSHLEALHRSLRNGPEKAIESAFELDQSIVELVTLLVGELTFRRPLELAGRAVLALIEPGCKASTLSGVTTHTTATASAATAV